MADTDTYYIKAPQTYLLTAFAAKRLYHILAQKAPTSQAQVYRQLEQDWDDEIKWRIGKYQMKQPPITRAQH